MDKVKNHAGFSEGEQSREEGLLGIFAKEPVSGMVKTRLSPPLEFEESSELYRVCLEETVARVAASGYRAVLFYEGREEFFRRAFPRTALQSQGAGCLGERMNRALTFLLSRGKKAALIGSDSPDLPLSIIDEAFFNLDRGDFVAVPSEDGGYVLVAVKKSCPGMFKDIPWSTEDVLEATRRRAAELNVRYLEAGRWEDVDDLLSLQRLVRRSPCTASARHAMKFLSGYL